jgi:hypothetical protein
MRPCKAKGRTLGTASADVRTYGVDAASHPTASVKPVKDIDWFQGLARSGIPA